MTARTIELRYQCDACHEDYDSVHKAIECCPKSVISVFVCPVCHSDYRDESDALQCWQECDPEEENTTGPSGPELEAQGQMRLDQV